MKPKSKSQAKTNSAAKLAANKMNAQKSTGPRTSEGKDRSRGNAVKHSLYATVLLPSQDTPENQHWIQHSMQLLAPRNALEELQIKNLLNTRLEESMCVHFERTVLLREPVSFHKQDGELFPFVTEQSGVQGFAALCRRMAHLTRLAEKDFLGLLRTRKHNQEVMSSKGNRDAVDEGSRCNSNVEASSTPQASPKRDLIHRALQQHLANPRVLLPGEDRQRYQALAESLWSSLAPSNLLEIFVVTDFIQTEWRLERVPRIEDALLAQRSFSAKDGNQCDLAFAFIHDSQDGQVLASLEAHKRVLRKRSDKLLSLFYRIRKAGWTDALSLNYETAPETQPTSTSDVPSASDPADIGCDNNEHPPIINETHKATQPQPIPGAASKQCSPTFPASALEGSPAAHIPLPPKQTPNSGIQQQQQQHK